MVLFTSFLVLVLGTGREDEDEDEDELEYESLPHCGALAASAGATS
jgi:hypothetical protein